VFLNLEHFNQVTKRVKDWRRDLLGKRESGGGKIDAEKEKLTHLESELRRYEDSLAEKKDKVAKEESLTDTLESEQTELTINEPLLVLLEDYDEKRLEKKERDQRIESLKEQHRIQKDRLDKLGELENSREDIQLQVEEFQYIEIAKGSIPDIRELVRKCENLDQQMQALSKTREDQQNKIEEKSTQVERIRPTKEEMEILSSSVNLRIVGVLIAIVAVLCLLGIIINLLFLVGSIPFIIFMIYVIYQYIRRISLSEKNTQFLSEQAKLQTLSESLENILEQIQDMESKIESAYHDLEIVVSNLPSELNEIWKDNDIESAQEILDQYDLLLRRYEDLQTELDNIDNQLKEKPELEEKVSKLEKEIESESALSQAITFPQLPEGISFSERLLRDTRAKNTELRESISGLGKEIEGLATRISELEEYLQENEGIHQKQTDQQAIVDELLQEEKISQMIIDAIETTSENLRNRVRPNVEQFMQRILPVITDNRYKAARLSETYDVEVWSDNAGEFQEKEMFSGGTEDQFLLAMRVAFALSLLPLRKYTRPDFLFLDEPLASSDAIRREGIMNLTHSVLSESFQQIIIISHVEELEDYVDHIIEVEAGKVRIS
jgi:DNA repair exonuclease SbcCD ATPase subunit